MDQETPVLGREKLGLHNLSKGSLSDLSTAAVHLAYDGMDEKQLRFCRVNKTAKPPWDARTWCGLLAERPASILIATASARPVSR
jgi:hypothetical protein